MRTPTEEKYLMMIYLLNMQGVEKITLSVISAALKKHPASVINMLKKLIDKRLIHYEKKGGAKLTESGRVTVVLILQKQDLWKQFLVEKLGYELGEAYSIATQLIHIKHPELIGKLNKFLGCNM